MYEFNDDSIFCMLQSRILPNIVPVSSSSHMRSGHVSVCAAAVEHLLHVREMLTEYADSLDFNLSFSRF